jgi:type I restriction enzyme, S subunit
MSKVNQIPESWSNTRIDKCCDILDSRRIPLSSEVRSTKKGNIPYYGANGLLDFINDYIFDEDLILVAEDGGNFWDYQKRPIAYKISGKSWVNNHAHILKPKTNFNFNYLFYQLEHKNIVPFINGSTREKLNQSDLRSILIPIPEKPHEQTAIATILSKVDEAIETTQNSIKAAEKVKKALMQNLFTGKLKPDGSWRTEDEFYEDEKFGKVPIGWAVKRVKDVFEINQKALPSQTDGNYKFRYITIEAVNTENIDFENCPEYLFKDSPGRARRIMINGDILISGVRPNLKAFVIYERPNDENWICSTGFYVLTAKENENNKFYFYQILSEIGEKQFHSYVAGSNYPAIGDRDIKNMKLLCPQYDEQLQIADKIGKVSLSNEQKQTKIRTIQRLKKSLMQNLLTGKVRLDVEKVNKIISEG